MILESFIVLVDWNIEFFLEKFSLKRVIYENLMVQFPPYKLEAWKRVTQN